MVKFSVGCCPGMAQYMRKAIEKEAIVDGYESRWPGKMRKFI